jgi:NADPH:quinone reductase-like Zn-dependent oxidoreductase
MLSLVATGPLEFDNVRVAQQEKPPKPGPLELLIRVEAAAVNPVDWKMVKYNMLIENYPATLGCSYFG